MSAYDFPENPTADDFGVHAIPTRVYLERCVSAGDARNWVEQGDVVVFDTNTPREGRRPNPRRLGRVVGRTFIVEGRLQKEPYLVVKAVSPNLGRTELVQLHVRQVSAAYAATSKTVMNLVELLTGEVPEVRKDQKVRAWEPREERAEPRRRILL